MFLFWCLVLPCFFSVETFVPFHFFVSLISLQLVEKMRRKHGWWCLKRFVVQSESLSNSKRTVTPQVFFVWKCLSCLKSDPSDRRSIPQKVVFAGACWVRRGREKSQRNELAIYFYFMGYPHWWGSLLIFRSSNQETNSVALKGKVLR